MNNWIEVTENRKEVEFTSNGYVIAKVCDEENCKSSFTKHIEKVDNTKPVNVLLTAEFDENENTILTATGEDKESGIQKYEISTDNKKTWQNKGLTTEYKIGKFSGIVYLKVTNNAGESVETNATIDMCPEGSIKITNASELKNISNDLAGTYCITNDIDMKDVTWTPISNFTGKIDGTKHKIKNLTSVGNFMAIASNASIKNLTFESRVQS